MKQEALDSMVVMVRKNLEQDGTLMPVFIVGNDQESAIVGAQFGSEWEKEACAVAIRDLAKKLKATWVLFVGESWSVPPRRGQEYIDGLRARKWNCVEQCPFRIEVVSFMLERKGQLDKIGFVEIVRKNGKATFPDPEFVEAESTLGRFTHFLGPRAVMKGGNDVH